MPINDGEEKHREGVFGLQCINKTASQHNTAQHNAQSVRAVWRRARWANVHEHIKRYVTDSGVGCCCGVGGLAMSHGRWSLVVGRWLLFVFTVRAREIGLPIALFVLYCTTDE